MIGLRWFVLLGLACSWVQAAPEVFQVSPGDIAALPGGKEADGIRGDFVLRNDRISLLIAAATRTRRGSMTLGHCSGALLDASPRDQKNDHWTALYPGSHEWPMTVATIVQDGSDGEAILRVEKPASPGDPLYVGHDYALRAQEEYVRITTLFRNEGRLPLRPPCLDRVRTEGLTGNVSPQGEFAYWWDKFDRAAYGLTVARGEVQFGPPRTWYGSEVRYSEWAADPLAPGEERRFTRFFLIGETPTELGRMAKALRREKTGILRGVVVDSDGLVVEADVNIALEFLSPGGGLALPLPTRTDARGTFQAWLTPGAYTVTVESLGRPRGELSALVQANQTQEVAMVLRRASRFVFDLHDEKGQGLPCKVQFIGQKGTPDPDFGPPERAHGARNCFLSENGRFHQAVPPGNYKLIISRGPEYDVLELDHTLQQEEIVFVRGTLRRVVQSQGWISADLHSHTTESGDNTTGIADRLISHAAEGVEFIPATEHNRLVDWQPTLDRLGLARFLTTCVGLEATGQGPHFNAFPLKPQPFTQDHGAPPWHPDPREMARLLHEWEGHSDKVVQLNHPDLGMLFNDADADGQADGGFEGLASLCEAVELYQPNILDIHPSLEGGSQSGHRIFHWLQFLNQGHRYTAVANSDAHHVFHQAGYPRNYVKSSTDDAGKIDPQEMVREIQAGHVVMTNGPFLEASCGDKLPGDTLTGGTVDLHVRVQCPNWFDVDRVQVLVNGRIDERYNLTRERHPEAFHPSTIRFDETLRIELGEDAHLIVVAVGEHSSIGLVGGPARQNERPVAITNPFFVDVDGAGFKPNGDTLGVPLPTM